MDAEGGARVHLAHPLGMKGITSNRRVKNDVRDAVLLADLLRLGSLPEAWIAPPATRELRELVRYRTKLVNMRASLKSQAHAVMAKEGVLPRLDDMFGPGEVQPCARGLQRQQEDRHFTVLEPAHHRLPLRLEAAREAGTISVSGVESLLDAYRMLTGLRLRHQIEQAATGRLSCTVALSPEQRCEAVRPLCRPLLDIRVGRRQRVVEGHRAHRNGITKPSKMDTKHGRIAPSFSVR